MLSIKRAVARRGNIGQALPMPWRDLRNHGLVFRRGQMSMVAAGAGVGKSVFAQSYALRAQIPTMYLSADSDEHTMGARTISMLTEVPTWDAEKNLDNYTEILAGADYVEWDFDGGPSLTDLEEVFAAYATMHGEFPALFVVDNLRNIQVQSAEKEHGWSLALDKFKLIARHMQAHAMILHHVTGQYNDGQTIVPLSGIEQQVAKLPEIVLTLHRKGEHLNVSVCKLRGGMADPSGRLFIPLEADLARMQLKDRRL